MSVDPQDITKIRRLLGEGNAAAIEQAVALIETLGPDVAQIFAEGIGCAHIPGTELAAWLDRGPFAFETDSEIHRRVAPELRALAAWGVLRAAGRLNVVERVAARDLHHLAGARGLKWLAVYLPEGCSLAPLGDIPDLTALYLRAIPYRFDGARHVPQAPPHTSGPTHHDVLARVDAARVELYDLGAEHAPLLESVARMPMLEQLTIDDSELEIGPLAACTRLSHIGISRSRVTSVAPLAGVSTLRTVHLRSLRDFEAASLQSLPQLETLESDPTYLTALVALPNVKRLVAGWVDLRDLDARTELTLRGGDAHNGPLVLSQEYAPLLHVVARMPKLERLVLEGCAFEDIDALAASPSLEEIVLRDGARQDGRQRIGVPMPLRSVERLGALRSLRALEIAVGPEFAWGSLAKLDTVTRVVARRSPADLGWAAGMPGLRELRVFGVQEALDAAALGRGPRLEVFETDTPVADLTPLSNAGALTTLLVGDGSQGAAALARMPTLTQVRARDCDLDPAGLRTLVASPRLTRCEVWGPRLPAALDRLSGAIDEVRAFLKSLAPRALPASQAPVDEAALKTAKRSLSAAFKAAKSPDAAVAAMREVPLETLRALGMDARIEEDGRLVGDTCDAKATHAADVLLAFADRAGLLDGAAVLDLSAHTHLASLAPLGRHRATLVCVDVRGCRAFKDQVLRGDDLTKALAEGTPARPARPEAPVELPEDLLTLLRGDAASVVQGWALANGLGVSEAVLDGCVASTNKDGRLHVRVGPAWRNPCPACAGSGSRGGGSCGSCRGAGTLTKELRPQQDGVLAALGDLPPGTEAAEQVLASVTALSALGPRELANVGWLRHARALQDVRLPWSVVVAQLDALASLPSLQSLTIDDIAADGDLACLHRLTALVVLRLSGVRTPIPSSPRYATIGAYSVAGLAGHSTVRGVHLTGTVVQHAEALAELPNLRALSVGEGSRCDVTSVCAKLATRTTVTLGGAIPRDGVVLNPAEPLKVARLLPRA